MIYWGCVSNLIIAAFRGGPVIILHWVAQNLGWSIGGSKNFVGIYVFIDHMAPALFHIFFVALDLELDLLVQSYAPRLRMLERPYLARYLYMQLLCSFLSSFFSDKLHSDSLPLLLPLPHLTTTTPN